jgi:hypothetical protein
MIRIIAVAALTLLLIFVLYLPAANPPERFLSQIHSEHEFNTAMWGEARAVLILERTLSMNRALSAASPVPTSAQAPGTDRMAEAVAQEMARVNQRFFGNTYFRSIDAQLLLSTYRLAALIEWLPLQAFVIIATVIDGFVVRILRAKQFKPHDPEWFALHASAFVLLACASIVAFVTPITIAPVLLAMLPLSGAFFLSRVVANFHRHG